MQGAGTPRHLAQHGVTLVDIDDARLRSLVRVRARVKVRVRVRVRVRARVKVRVRFRVRFRVRARVRVRVRVGIDETNHAKGRETGCQKNWGAVLRGESL